MREPATAVVGSGNGVVVVVGARRRMLGEVDDADVDALTVARRRDRPRPRRRAAAALGVRVAADGRRVAGVVTRDEQQRPMRRQQRLADCHVRRS